MPRLSILISILLLSPLYGSPEQEKHPLKDLLSSLELTTAKKPESGKIPFTQFFHLSKELHQELATQFTKDHPKLWETALNSSGNSHNPKVTPLRSKFPSTLKNTPTLQKIETHLNKTGYTLGKITFEKFSFTKESDGIKFYSIVYDLPFSKIKEQTPTPKK